LKSAGENNRGNADGFENKGVAKRSTQKLMKIRELKIDRFRGAVQVAEERRGGTGALSAEPWIGDYRIRYYLSSEKLRAVH
jgi:hypothetical protein